MFLYKQWCSSSEYVRKTQNKTNFKNGRGTNVVRSKNLPFFEKPPRPWHTYFPKPVTLLIAPVTIRVPNFWCTTHTIGFTSLCTTGAQRLGLPRWTSCQGRNLHKENGGEIILDPGKDLLRVRVCQFLFIIMLNILVVHLFCLLFFQFWVLLPTYLLLLQIPKSQIWRQW